MSTDINKQFEDALKKEGVSLAEDAAADLAEEVYPLGTVVDLKKNRLTGIPGIEEIKEFRVVIIQRFAHEEGKPFYHTYGGVIYPVGTMGFDTVIYFGGDMIENVIQEGYKDDQDEAFVYLMKKELIVEKGLHSRKTGE